MGPSSFLHPPPDSWTMGTAAFVPVLWCQYHRENLTKTAKVRARFLHRVWHLKHYKVVPGTWLSWKLLCACTNTGTMVWMHSFWNVRIISRSMSEKLGNYYDQNYRQRNYQYSHLQLYWLIKLYLHSTRHKIGHFRDDHQAKRLAWFGKTKPHTTKAHIHWWFSSLLQHPAWKQRAYSGFCAS